MINAYVDPGARYAALALFSQKEVPAGVLVGASLVRCPLPATRPHAEQVRATARALIADLDRLLGDLSLEGAPPARLVVEDVQQYPRGRSRGRRRDVQRVGQVALAITTLFTGPVDTVLPAQWKGQTPKQVMNRRVVRCLAREERAVLEGFPRRSLGHVLDAVGIGLNDLGRLQRRGRGVRRTQLPS